MRVRRWSIFQCIFILALLVIILSWTLAPQPVSTAKAHAFFASVPALAASPSPTATSTPSFTDQITQNIINPIQAVANLAATFLIIALAGIIIRRIIILISSSNKNNLVIETFTNSTGNTDLEKVLPGLTQRMREILTHEIEGVREHAKRHQELAPNSDQPLDKILTKAPISQEELDGQLTNLLKSLQDVATGQVKTAVQLISLAFPPRGTKVITVLNSIGETNVQLGMSLEVTDLQDSQRPTLYTIGEPSITSTAASTSQSGASGHKSNKPTHSSLLQMLEEVVKPGKSPAEDKPDLQTPEEHFIKLQRPVARWLAIELIRRSMAAYGDRIRSKRDRDIYNAKLYNFTGAFHLSSAELDPFSYYAFFYDLAVHDFQLAIGLFPAWYQPYENLGDTYSILGEQVQDNNRVSHQYQAISSYDSALKYLLAPPIPGLSEETPEERKGKERRIRAEKASAQLQIAIQTKDSRLTQQARQEVALAEQGWDATSETDSHLLYNLACCHALLGETQIAHRYLTYSLARDDSLLYSASIDPELKSIIDGLDNLHVILSQKLQDDPRLQKLTGMPFENEINTVLSAANWLS